MTLWQIVGRVMRRDGRTFAINIAVNVLAWLLFAVPGLVTQRLFDLLQGHSQVQMQYLNLLAVVATTELVRSLAHFVNVYLGTSALFSVRTLIRSNLLGHLLSRPGAQAAPEPPAVITNRIGDDVDAIVNFIDQLQYLAGQTAFAIIGLVLLLRVSVVITSVVFIPLTVIIVVAKLSLRNVARYREASREWSGKVSDALAEMFNSVMAVKIAGAESNVISRFESMNRNRMTASLKESVFSAVVNSVFANAITIGSGLTLLLAASSMHTGRFTVGDLALFNYFLGYVTVLIGAVGNVMTTHKQADVSLKRLDVLLEGSSRSILVQPLPAYLDESQPALPDSPTSPLDRLEEVEVRNLSLTFPGSKRGLANTSFALKKGGFTVITGRTGSGKTTLVRAMLGLLPVESGEIRWNGRSVSSVAQFMQPPRVGYTAQVAGLFSETLRTNILLGLVDNETAMCAAVHASVLERDISEMPDGLGTQLGARGVRLSGGQLQRTAVARALFRTPELLVFDDVSSALDVETEQTLWDRIIQIEDTTYLVVSNRRSVLARADSVIVMQGGAICGIGKLEDLLATNYEMQRIWHGQTYEI